MVFFMFSKPYVRQLCDNIINHQPLSSDQLFYLVDIVSDYLYDNEKEYDFECHDDFHRAKLSLIERGFDSLYDD